MENSRNGHTLPISNGQERGHQKPETPPKPYEEACELRSAASALANQPSHLIQTPQVTTHWDHSDDDTSVAAQSTRSREQCVVYFPQNNSGCNLEEFVRPINLTHNTYRGRQLIFRMSSAHESTFKPQFSMSDFAFFVCGTMFILFCIMAFVMVFLIW